MPRPGLVPIHFAIALAMTNLDQFESVFKAAEKTIYTHEAISMSHVLILTDQSESASQPYVERIQRFLRTVQPENETRWTMIYEGQFDSVCELLAFVKREDPDLVVSYRNLFLPPEDYPYSLGVHLDVLTQATDIPVLVTPSPTIVQNQLDCMADTSVVMAITDHLALDHHLVSIAARMTAKHGSLWLTHIEDQATFERFIEAIARIPSIDTDNAREEILKQLLKQPADFIESCQATLEEVRSDIRIKSEVVLGKLLNDYKRLIASHNVSLLVMNTKDDQQLAMHGMAYPLSIEMRETPLLLV